MTIGRIAHLLIRVVPGRPKFLGAVSAQFGVHAVTIDGIKLFESIEEWMDTVSTAIKALNWRKHSDSCRPPARRPVKRSTEKPLVAHPLLLLL